MPRFLVPLFLAVLMGMFASAQAGVTRGAPPIPVATLTGPGNPVQPEKRRESLRESLKSPVNDSESSGRQLSAEEKAELREQLRQQHPMNSKP